MRPKYYKICNAKIYNKKLYLESGRQSDESKGPKGKRLGSIWVCSAV